MLYLQKYYLSHSKVRLHDNLIRRKGERERVKGTLDR